MNFGSTDRESKYWILQKKIVTRCPRNFAKTGILFIPLKTKNKQKNISRSVYNEIFCREKSYPYVSEQNKNPTESLDKNYSGIGIGT